MHQVRAFNSYSETQTGVSTSWLGLIVQLTLFCPQVPFSTTTALVRCQTGTEEVSPYQYPVESESYIYIHTHFYTIHTIARAVVDYMYICIYMYMYTVQ